MTDFNTLHVETSVIAGEPIMVQAGKEGKWRKLKTRLKSGKKISLDWIHNNYRWIPNSYVGSYRAIEDTTFIFCPDGVNVSRLKILAGDLVEVTEEKLAEKPTQVFLKFGAGSSWFLREILDLFDRVG